MNCDNCGKDMANDGGIHVCDTAYCNTADSPVTSAALDCCIATTHRKDNPMDTYEIECTECGWQGFNADLLCSDADWHNENPKFNICPECDKTDCHEDIDEE